MAAPKLLSVSNSPFPVTVSVVFDSAMAQDGYLYDTANYLFNNGAYAVDVEVISATEVRLFVENLFEYDNFTLNVGNVTNTLGETIDSSYNSMSFSILRPTVPGYALSLTSANGKLKSGTNAKAIDEDTGHWYIMTESGVDIVNRTTFRNEGYILDGYGIGFTTIHVSRND